MSDAKKPGAPVPSAESLRMNVLERHLAEMERGDKLKDRERQERAAFADAFFKEHIGEAERAMVNRMVQKAVNEGKMEALVYSFSSDLCTDGGRAINSNLPNWPDTLQGKARELYDRFKEVAQPEGYRLKAMIINFPGGVPGDVGLFLNWAPPAV